MEEARFIKFFINMIIEVNVFREFVNLKRISAKFLMRLYSLL